MPASTTNQKLKDWVDHWAGVLQPDAVEWCDGSEEEWDRLTQLLVDARHVHPARRRPKRPNSFLAQSDPGDVARVEDRTFICSEEQIDAGPTNNWRPPAEMKAELTGLYTGAPCGAAPCTWCPSRWARSAPPSPTSACSSPTRPTSWSTCGS
jgi:phosphoenolpyruvate carboxykinase (GTP)